MFDLEWLASYLLCTFGSWVSRLAGDMIRGSWTLWICWERRDARAAVSGGRSARVLLNEQRILDSNLKPKTRNEVLRDLVFTGQAWVKRCVAVWWHPGTVSLVWVSAWAEGRRTLNLRV